MKKIVFIAGLFLLHFGIFAQDVSLDGSFGDGGMIVLESNSEMDKASVKKILTDNEGRFVCFTEQRVKAGETCILLARYNSDGSLDRSFGVDGLTHLSFGPVYNDLYDALIRPNGEILVCGDSTFIDSGSMETTQTPFFAKLDENGILDVSVAENGNIMPEFSALLSFIPTHFLAGLNGNFFCYRGYGSDVIAKFNPDNTLDNDFGENGEVHFSQLAPSFYITTLIQLNDGSVLCGGKTGTQEMYEFAIVKLKADGSLDTNFGNGGIFSSAIAPYNLMSPQDFENVCFEIKILSNLQIMAAGTAYGNKRALVKINPDGSLDETFGNKGILLYNKMPYYYGFVVQANTDGIVIITESNNQINGFSFACYDRYGKLRSDNLVETSNNENYLLYISLQSDGKLLLSSIIGEDIVLMQVILEDLNPVGINDPVAEVLEISVQTNGIAVRGIVQGEVITVYNAAGMLVATAVAGEKETVIPVSDKGVYIVRTSEKAAKIVL